MKILLTIFLATSLNAQTLIVKRTLDAITIDGALSESVWQEANFIELVNDKISILWDDINIYIAIDRSSADNDLRAAITTNDTRDIWFDDSIEIVFDVASDGGWNENDFKTIINIRGAKYDQNNLNYAWNGPYEVALIVNGTINDGPEDGGWIAEMAMPWKSLNTSPKKSLNMNFMVNDRDSEERMFFPWSGGINNVSDAQPVIFSDELAGPPGPPDTTVQVNVRLTWNPNPEPDLAGYRIFTGLQPRDYSTAIDVGNVTQYSFAGLATGFTHYFAATAYDTAGNESGYSEEVSAFLLPAQEVTWAPPRFKLLTDTLGLTKEALISAPPLLDTLDVADGIWIATWKDSAIAESEGWDIEDADSLVYRFKGVQDAIYEHYTQIKGQPEAWVVSVDESGIYEMSVSAHKAGGQATFATSAYFRNVLRKGFILLQVRK